jgi:hypothetical protein
MFVAPPNVIVSCYESVQGFAELVIGSLDDAPAIVNADGMCRNIRVLYNFEPPTTPEEIRAAALQYVRKVSGVTKPSEADLAVFYQAVDEIAVSTERLLSSLVARAPARTREGEREKGRARWAARERRARG